MAADDELMTVDTPQVEGVVPIDAALVLSLEEDDLPDPPADSELIEDEGDD